jgi:hypothetical protein
VKGRSGNAITAIDPSTHDGTHGIYDSSASVDTADDDVPSWRRHGEKVTARRDKVTARRDMVTARRDKVTARREKVTARR